MRVKEKMMSIVNSVARSMLAAVFIWGGIDTLRNPKPRVEAAKPLFDKTAEFGAPITWWSSTPR